MIDMAYLVTRKAGSVIVSGPTRTWPCSMNLVAYIADEYGLEESGGY